MQRHSLFMFSLVCADCQESVPSVIHSPIRHELEILSVNVFTLNIQPVLTDRSRQFLDSQLVIICLYLWQGIWNKMLSALFAH